MDCSFSMSWLLHDSMKILRLNCFRQKAGNYAANLMIKSPQRPTDEPRDRVKTPPESREKSSSGDLRIRNELGKRYPLTTSAGGHFY